MNLPNKLTVLRILLIPVFLVFYFAQSLPLHYIWALIVFGLASFTDALDGKIARKHNLITDFGKLMDPLADKLLVMSALICLLQNSVLNLICLILIMSREFLVTSIRLIAAGKGVVLAADVWGKMKTVTQMTWICLELLLRALTDNMGLGSESLMPVLNYVAAGLFFAAVALTVLSGLHYCWKNRALFAGA